jgi:hypothetical protein
MASGDDSPAGWLLQKAKGKKQGTAAGFGLSEIIKE